MRESEREVRKRESGRARVYSCQGGVTAGRLQPLRFALNLQQTGAKAKFTKAKLKREAIRSSTLGLQAPGSRRLGKRLVGFCGWSRAIL
jgi:hypothetical protein